MSSINKAYSKITFILKVYKSYSFNNKHRIKGLFVLNKKIYDTVIIKNSKNLVIKYYVGHKRLFIDDCCVKKSIQYMQQRYHINTNIDIVIHKNIPLMSGIGGSATDAACVVKWLCRKNKINVQTLDMKHIALHCGSDIPFFLHGYDKALVECYGDRVSPWVKTTPLYRLHLTNQKVSSKNVFDLLTRNTRYVSCVNFAKCYDHLLNNRPLSQHVYNDLQTYAFRINPKLQTIYNHMDPGLRFISGSGGSIVEILTNNKYVRK